MPECCGDALSLSAERTVYVSIHGLYEAGWSLKIAYQPFVTGVSVCVVGGKKKLEVRVSIEIHVDTIVSMVQR